LDRANLSIGLSAIALLLAGYAAVRGAGREPAPAPAASAPLSAAAAPAPAERSDFDVRLIQSLERRLAALEASGPQRATTAPDTTAVAAAMPSGTAAARLKDGRPRFVRFDVGRSNVAITQDDEGAIAVTNRDPTLTGKTLIVRGVTEDGSETAMTVTVPPP
jgi:hypothetical protein